MILKYCFSLEYTLPLQLKLGERLTEKKEIVDMSSMELLCQRDGGRSCATCCGIYYFPDSSRGFLQKVLRERARILPPSLAGVDGETLSALGREIRRQEPSSIFSDLDICPFVGFLKGKEERVGCLLHPKVTGGKDLRILGIYTPEICGSYRCPPHQWFTREEVEILTAVVNDWYLWGLLVTDVDLVRSVLCLLADSLGEVPSREVVQSGDAREILFEFFRLKEHRPWGDSGRGYFGRFAVKGKVGELCPRESSPLSSDNAAWLRILRSLDLLSAPEEEIEKAKNYLQALVEKFLLLNGVLSRR